VAPRLAFDREALELMAPSQPHEQGNRVLALPVEVVADGLGVDVLDIGPAKRRRPDLGRGIEPDSAFSVQHEPRVRGRSRIDLAVDLDLVIEVEVAHPLLDRPGMLASPGSAEVWRPRGTAVEILLLAGDAYRSLVRSVAFPLLTAEALSRFVAYAQQTKRTDWLRSGRAGGRAMDVPETERP